jgi:hypothetical protein
MHPPLTKRIEIPRTRVIKNVAILLALPSWVFIAGAFLFSRWMGEYFLESVATAFVCCICSAYARLLLVRSRGNAEVTRSSRLLSLWAESPVVLIPLLAILYGLFVVVSFYLGLPRGHDSM